MFKTIKDFPLYEISRKGDVRHVGDKTKLKILFSKSGAPYVRMRQDQRWRSRSLNVLLHENFGPGAAEAAGLSEPNMKKVLVQRELAQRPRSGKSLGDDSNPNKFTRTCATCNKPTNNYRCEECWRALRGFGMDGTGEFHTDNYPVHL